MSAALQRLIQYALHHALIDAEDVYLAQNTLLDMLGMDEPAPADAAELPIPDTATPLLAELIDDAASRGVIDLSDGPSTRREMWEARIMGALTPWPSAIVKEFEWIEESAGIASATEWFYALCRANNYIRVDDIARNVRYLADTDVGRLEITINLSKPEKTPEEIAKLKGAPASGYPKCMLCIENEGYAGRLNHPARQNLRTIPVELGDEPWHFQYSPYLYYPEHCIVLNTHHHDMAITRRTFERLCDFIDRFPHYFIGSNADLPIVGGSILNHDHFQGGRYTFPMEASPVRETLDLPFLPGVRVSLLEWPMTTVRLTGDDREALVEAATRVLSAWRGYSDPSLDILHETVEEGVRTPHNTITPILRRRDDAYELDLVLRNNRTTPERPRGLFHPRPALHNIKQENIGLIEVMGLFILPGRLLAELGQIEALLSARNAEEHMARIEERDHPLYKHRAWIRQLRDVPFEMDAQEAHRYVRQEVANVCAQVLQDAGVFKATPEGDAGVRRFLQSIR